MQRLNEKTIRDEQRKDDDHEFPPFVTAAGDRTFQQVTQLVASLQSNMPGRKIYIYDLDLTADQKKHVRTNKVHNRNKCKATVIFHKFNSITLSLRSTTIKAVLH